MVEHAALIGQALALASGLALLAAALWVRGAPDRARVAVAQDLGYIGLRIVLYVPLTAAVLGGLDAAVTAWAPWLRIGVLTGLPPWGQLLAWIVLVDLASYWLHRLFHEVPWLWPFHAVHHSQTWVNPLTTTRIHVLELVVKRVFLWAPFVVLGEPGPWLVWIALDGFWGFLVHSGLRVPLGPLRYLVVEPSFHLAHHSAAPEHYGANLGERLAIWDVLFGTARFDVQEVPVTGVDDPGFPVETSAGPAAVVRTLLAQAVYPFRPRPGWSVTAAAGPAAGSGPPRPPSGPGTPA